MPTESYLDPWADPLGNMDDATRKAQSRAYRAEHPWRSWTLIIIAVLAALFPYLWFTASVIQDHLSP